MRSRGVLVLSFAGTALIVASIVASCTVGGGGGGALRDACENFCACRGDSGSALGTCARDCVDDFASEEASEEPSRRCLRCIAEASCDELWSGKVCGRACDDGGSGDDHGSSYGSSDDYGSGS